MGRDTQHFDWITTLLLLCLVIFGLFLLLTISSDLFWQQLLYLVVGAVLLFLFSRIDTTVLWWFAPYGYVLSVVFLLVSFLGPNIRGATRWLVIAGVQLQPSELVKPFLLLAFARFISQYSPRNLKYLPLHIVLFAIPFFLVFRQPDLGTSLVYGAAWLMMLLSGGLPVSVLVGGVACIAVLLPVFWHLLAEYQKARILTFLDPSIDPHGAGYNALQSMIAVGSGEFFGRGLGRGTQSHLRFLPEYHTDFIFATLAEELGFVGGALLLLGYAVLLWRMLRPLLRGEVTDVFGFAFSAGLFGILLSQIFINAGMNMGIIPVTGITLPLISAGGSSLLSFAVSFGLLWAFQLRRSAVRSVAIG